MRKSKAFISRVIDKDDQQLVAITIIPSQPIIALGHLVNFSIDKLQRRLQFALDKIGLCAVIGGIDFSYNEDRDGKYQPFWCIHVYIVTSIGNRGRIKRQLKRIYLSDSRIPRPIKISGFSNSARRRSYAFKTIFFRRVGYDAVIIRNGVERKCRDTSQDRLRVRERLELFAYLDQCGLAQRLIFRAAKPIISSSGVRVCAINSVLSYQGNSKKRQKMAKNSAKMGSCPHRRAIFLRAKARAARSLPLFSNSHQATNSNMLVKNRNIASRSRQRWARRQLLANLAKSAARELSG